MNLEAVTENLGSSYERETKLREQLVLNESLMDRREEGHHELIRELHDERLAIGTLRDRILNLKAEVEYLRKVLAKSYATIGKQRDELNAARDESNSPGVCAYGMCQVVIFDSAKYCDRHEADIAMGLADDG